jgi:hypothetical protein
LEGPAMEDVGLFYGQLVYFRAIWSILWSFDIFTAIWSILWPFVMFVGHFSKFSHFGMFYKEKSGNPVLMKGFFFSFFQQEQWSQVYFRAV